MLSHVIYVIITRKQTFQEILLYHHFDLSSSQIDLFSPDVVLCRCEGNSLVLSRHQIVVWKTFCSLEISDCCVYLEEMFSFIRISDADACRLVMKKQQRFVLLRSEIVV